MVDRELLSRKLSNLSNYINELQMADDINWEKYTADPRSKAFVERYLHLAIEEVFDIANHLVSFHRWREPTGYRDLLLVLKENHVVPAESLSTFQNMASFRNMLVHHYEKIDDEVVFGIFKKRLPDFSLFIDLIRQWSENVAEQSS
jgi:uncharacterized protein YutE (UPF0331/DUF86 family)